jgi:uncharacterized protein with GYD domain
MPTYITLANYTDQGVRNVKEAPKRLDAAKELLRSLGGDMKAFYLTMGNYDIVAIVDAPNDEAAATALLALGAKGNVRTLTMRAFGEAEFRKIVEALP